MSDPRVRALDTSAVSYIQRNQETWARRLRGLSPGQRAVPVIVAEEQMRGRLAQIARANQKGDRVAIEQAYSRFTEAITFFNTISLLPFDDAAFECFAELRRQHRQHGTNDLRIAAIALNTGAVVVTGNISHFTNITGLEVETWA